ncbi:hypothetical protein [Chromobacterium violaceum]|uniref:Uncharacterized protein n=2 Tax=Chromobacterium violaceum TaxID=536 RepID=Q7P250_CHRVO|nr:hypothetical protein [Chromobacterium violaceum]AAQ57691.1 hypothetical protein CV_0011 [Chromobacterium violaceum ATCC 12472]OVE50008.1 hypothetical protein CBW21_01785 [Chromobacterium violaceum]SUX40708.1 Uncharacterised protein [Chromobacterium violaceum]
MKEIFNITTCNSVKSLLWSRCFIGAIAIFLLSACVSGYSYDPIWGLNYKQGELRGVAFNGANRSDIFAFSYELYRLNGGRLYKGDIDTFSRGGGGLGGGYLGGVFPRPGEQVRIRWKAYPLQLSLEEFEALPWRERVITVEGTGVEDKLPVVATIMCDIDDVHVYVFGKKEYFDVPHEIKAGVNPFYWACKNNV